MTKGRKVPLTDVISARADDRYAAEPQKEA